MLHVASDAYTISPNEVVPLKDQWHTFDVLLTQCVLAIQWLNPFAWLYKKSLEQNLEFIADAGAQESLECKKTYQYTLLKTGFTQQQIAITNNFFHSPIKKRIMMLQKRKSRKTNQLKYVFIIPILALFLMNFNTEDVYVDKTMTTNNLEKNKCPAQSKRCCGFTLTVGDCAVARA